MEGNADSIREYAGRILEQARRVGQVSVTIQAGDIVREMHLLNRTPAVCSALASLQFQRRYRAKLIHREGPPSGMSTTSRFTYDLVDAEAKEGQKDPHAAFMALRGAWKDLLTEEGGVVAFIQKERDEFNSSMLERETFADRPR